MQRPEKGKKIERFEESVEVDMERDGKRRTNTLSRYRPASEPSRHATFSSNQLGASQLYREKIQSSEECARGASRRSTEFGAGQDPEVGMIGVRRVL
ncbi:hypothetical protein KM043_005567 [Ampulex compressa]|nr:hypothetical protein KM043_005567 [Ampulex compressa]